MVKTVINVNNCLQMFPSFVFTVTDCRHSVWDMNESRSQTSLGLSRTYCRISRPFLRLHNTIIYLQCLLVSKIKNPFNSVSCMNMCCQVQVINSRDYRSCSPYDLLTHVQVQLPTKAMRGFLGASPYVMCSDSILMIHLYQQRLNFSTIQIFSFPDVPKTSGECVSSGESRYSVLSDAARHGPHPLRRTRRPAWTRRSLAGGWWAMDAKLIFS